MTLNAAQKQSIDSVLEIHLDFSDESPKDGITVLESMLINGMRLHFYEWLRSKNFLSSVDAVRAMLVHKNPQNRYFGNEIITHTENGILNGFVYYYQERQLLSEPRGLFGLTALNHKDTPPVRRNDVQNYIRHKIFLEIYNKKLATNKTNWLYTVKNNEIFSTIQSCFNDALYETLKSQEKEYCQHSLKYEGCEILIIARPNLFYLNGNNKSQENHLDTFICVTAAYPKSELIMTLLSTDEFTIPKCIEGKLLLDKNGNARLTMSFRGKDSNIKYLLHVLNKYLFDDEIPSYLFNALLDAAGQEMNEYSNSHIILMGLGLSHQRKKRISDAISLSKLQPILEIIHDYDFASSNEHTLRGKALFDAAIKAWDMGLYEVALEKFIFLADSGFVDVRNYLYGLAELLFKAKNFVLAAELYQKTASLGHTAALAKLDCLGHMYIDGNGVIKNLKKAFELFQYAANLGFVNSKYNLGVCYERGDGVEQNCKYAFKLYREAARAGHRTASLVIKNMELHEQNATLEAGAAKSALIFSEKNKHSQADSPSDNPSQKNCNKQKCTGREN